MNNAKKIMKNQGVKTAVSPKKASGGMETKTKVLLILGILAALGLCGIVLFINLRPRPILTVSGTDSKGQAVTNTVNYKDVVYDIYTTETQYINICLLLTRMQARAEHMMISDRFLKSVLRAKI